jgi:3,4-dihydroxy 2-butanone 4-phosphate synthase / GTP cyclohydrolase II
VALVPVHEAVAALRRGEFLVVVDDSHGSGEGDLVVAADAVRPHDVAFMLGATSGILTVPLPADVAERHLEAASLPVSRSAMVTLTTARRGRRVSARETMALLGAVLDPATRTADLRRVGNLLPIEGRQRGAVRRSAHAEALLDLARLAGRAPAVVLSNVLVDGRPADLASVLDLAVEHELAAVPLSELEHVRRPGAAVERAGTGRLPTRHARFTAHAYRGVADGSEHLALVLGDVEGHDDVVVRLHSECLTGDVMGSRRCDCGEQLDLALARVAAEGRGVVIYLRGHEGRGVGLVHKVRAYALQDAGYDTVAANEELGLPVDSRDYAAGAGMLADLGVGSVRLLTNNPQKVSSLEEHGVKVSSREALVIEPGPDNAAYLATKRDRLGHLL